MKFIFKIGYNSLYMLPINESFSLFFHSFVVNLFLFLSCQIQVVCSSSLLLLASLEPMFGSYQSYFEACCLNLHRKFERKEVGKQIRNRISDDLFLMIWLIPQKPRLFLSQMRHQFMTLQTKCFFLQQIQNKCKTTL